MRERSATTAARIESLREATAEAGLDAYVATADESIAYLTGYRPLQLERFFGVVVRSAGGGGVIVPRLDAGQLRSVPDSLERVAYDAASDGLAELSGLLEGARKVGVEEDHIVFARSAALAARGHDPQPAGALIADQRARKDSGEVEAVRRACGLIEQAYEFAWAALRRDQRAPAERAARRVPARPRGDRLAPARPLR